MNVLSYVFPQTLLVTSSPFNAHIRVNLERGRPKLLVNGCRESGEQIERLWAYAFTHLSLPKEKDVKKILVLGVAGGTVIEMLRHRYPTAEITGVDIDKTMIDIGKRYFGLDTLDPIRFVVSDARDYIKTKERYDLIILDIYIGPVLPEFLLKDSFQSGIRGLLRNDGMLFINYEHLLGYEEKAVSLEKEIKKIYHSVTSADISSNRFFKAAVARKKM